MKIAFVDEDLSPRTGSRRFTYEVTRELQKLGHEVNILTSRIDKKTCFGEYLSLPVEVMLREEFHHKGILKRTLGHRKNNLLLWIGHILKYYLMGTNRIMNLSKRTADTGCEVALVHYHGEHWLLPFFYFLREPKGVVYLNVVPPDPHPWILPYFVWRRMSLRRRIGEKLLDLPPVGRWKETSFRKLAMFIAPSRYQLEQAGMQGIIGRRKADVVPLGVDHSEFSPTGEEEPYALYLGRIHPHKSLELAIHAMKKTDKSLIIAGDLSEEYLWYKEKLTSLAEKVKVSDRFEMILFPSDSQVVRLMQRCSLFLFPSTIDTFGLVVLEAMACGKPIVACNRGGVPEIVNNAGFLLEPEVRQWRETVTRLLSNSELRERMGEKALERSKAFSWENTAKQLLRAFNSLNGTK